MSDRIRFRCQFCDLPVGTAASNAGKQGKCPVCGGLTTIPMSSPPPLIYVPGRADGPPAPGRRVPNGQLVRIVSGEFAGLDGRLEDVLINRTTQYKVRLTIGGQQRVIVVEESAAIVASECPVGDSL